MRMSGPSTNLIFIHVYIFFVNTKFTLMQVMNLYFWSDVIMLEKALAMLANLFKRV